MCSDCASRISSSCKPVILCAEALTRQSELPPSRHCIKIQAAFRQPELAQNQDKQLSYVSISMAWSLEGHPFSDPQ